jgi:hypothetical protein
MAKKKATGKVITIKREQKKKFADMLVASPNNTIEEIIARLNKEEKDRLSVAHEILRKVCPELFLLGVAQVVAHYDGAGDSGDIDTIYANNINGLYMAWPPKSGELRAAIEKAIWEFIPGGFEINDGSFGDITIKIQTNEIVREHNERVIEINASEKTFTF